MDRSRWHRYDRLHERMWDRAAQHGLALGAIAGFLSLYSCNGGGPGPDASAQACQIDADCSGATPNCDPERRVCVECTENADCDASEICTTANTCRMIIPCVSRTECPIDLVCDQDAGFCVDCVGDNDCDDGEVCASDSQCRIGCDTDKDCQAEGLLCALDDGVCVACVDHVDCSEAEYCRVGTCVSDSCDPGHQECSGDELLTCSDSGSGFDSRTCADGCAGAPGSASCVEGTTSTGGSNGGAASNTTSGGGESGTTTEGAGGSPSSGGSTSGQGGSGATGGVGGSSAGNGGAAGNGGSGGSGQCGAPLQIPVIYRDFDATHPDFSPGYESDGVSGVVEQFLNNEGKPVLVGSSNSEANIQSQQSFAEWYTDSNASATIPGELSLYQDGMGGFVNRWGPNGEQWLAYKNPMQVCGSQGDACQGCSLTQEQSCVDPCPPFIGTGSCAAVVESLDGNPLFFPIDGDPGLLDDEPQQAKIPPAYGPDGWPWEQAYLGNEAVHNFLFTTEIHIEFAYDAERTQHFSFLGDDDLWVFLNGALILDLGGWHEPLFGEFSVDPETADSYGLEDGQMYEIAVFHAERQPEGSSFLMRLEGFGDLCD